MRGTSVLESRTERVDCDAAYGKERRVGRLAPFGLEQQPRSEGHEGEVEDPESSTPQVDASSSNHPGAAERKGERKQSAAERALEVADVPSHAFDGTEEVSVDVTPVTVVEFEAVTAIVEFGYGRYQTRSTDPQVRQMVEEIQARRALGEVPVLEIQGSASFVPVKNHQAYKSNEQLAKMRAERARDAMIRALGAQGLQVGVDFIIVLDWGVAGPSYQGDAQSKRDEYRNYQFAKFSLGRQLIERR